MYLTDLAFIEEGTPNYTEDGLVNFSKMRMVCFPVWLWGKVAGRGTKTQTQPGATQAPPPAQKPECCSNKKYHCHWCMVAFGRC